MKALGRVAAAMALPGCLNAARESAGNCSKHPDIADDTLVILTSDNAPREGVGGRKSAWPWRGYKGGIWEGGHRVPFIVRWPGKTKPGTASDELVCLTDLMATSVAIIGAKLPMDAGEDSYNLLPALLGERLDKPIREAIVHHSGGGAFAIRQGDWKLIIGTKGAGYHRGPEPDSPGQLYNLAADPQERSDLWDRHPEIVQHLTKLLARYKRQGYSRPISGQQGRMESRAI